jgi:hypothetical protein
MTQDSQLDLNLPTTQGVDSVEDYTFEPIKGYPMLNWQGKRPFTNTRYYPAQLKERHGEDVNGWLNKIFWGDNLQVMSHLLKMTYRMIKGSDANAARYSECDRRSVVWVKERNPTRENDNLIVGYCVPI